MHRGIVGLIGKAGSGKDTFAGRLVEKFGFTKVAFADSLKDILLTVNPIIEVDDYHGGLSVRLDDIVHTMGWDGAKALKSVRRELQTFGGAVRKIAGEDVWIKAAQRRVEAVKGPVVVSDVRYRNEAQWIRERGGSLVRIVRPNLTLTDFHEHESETDLDAFVTEYLILNDGNIERMFSQADDLATRLDYLSVVHY